jgi:phenylacetic acid degradation operon negative regulatory protein
MKRSGMLLARRHGRSAGYELSPDTVQLLEDGDQRIFRTTAGASSPGWLLAIFSVPENQRNRRYLIRSRLASLGFGTVTSGVMVAPPVTRSETEHMLRRTRLDEFVTLWDGSLGGREAELALVADAWDLAAISRSYHAFLTEFTPVVDRWRSRSGRTPQAAFADYLGTLSSWRHIPYLDPGLPAVLLPADWPGAKARALFLEIVERLAPPALEHFMSVVGSSAMIAND